MENKCVMIDNLDEILFLKRDENDRHNPDLWEFPGGKLDKGEDVNSAAKREVFEETGIIIDSLPDTKHVESYVINYGPYKGSAYVAIHSLIRIVKQDIKVSHEHSDFTWKNYEDAIEMELSPDTRTAMTKIGSTAIRSV